MSKVDYRNKVLPKKKNVFRILKKKVMLVWIREHN